MSALHEEAFRMIEERFRAGKPSEAEKRKRRTSKRVLVQTLLPEIEGLLREGYTLESVAGYFVDIGLDMPVSTLKNYVTRARRDAAQRIKGRKKRAKSTDTRQDAVRVEVRNTNPPARTTEPAESTPSPSPPARLLLVAPSAESGNAGEPEPTRSIDGIAPLAESEELPALSLEELRTRSGATSSSFAVPRRKRLDDL